MTKHYSIKKIVICDLAGEQCGKPYIGKNDFCCEYCDYYKEWKQSGMSLEEWIKNTEEREIVRC